jgi:predicted TIM-barrel fold metal-dependent hydrolase
MAAAMRVIDGDGHVMENAEGISAYLPSPYREAGPFTWFDLVAPIDHLHVMRGQMPPGAFRQDVGPADWRAFLDDVGIERTVLYPSKFLAYGKIVDRDAAIAVTRAYNDWLYHTYLQADRRFHGMALIPMQEPPAAVAELRRAVTELGMCGAMLPATGLSENLGAKAYWPVYEEADRLGCCLAVHGGCHDGLGMDNLNVFPAVHALGHAFAVTIGFSAIIANGVLDRFPNTRFAFLEGGVAWLLLAIERLSGSWRAFRPYNPRGELLTLPAERSVGDYILGLIEAGRLFVGCEGDESALPYVVQAAGSASLLYSSDFPHEVNNATCKEELEELRDSSGFSATDVEAILYRNAERFYRFPSRVAQPVG